ncbi:hypothetical protein [Pedobacter sp. ASV28]|uniref:hypothetical protein n=1 Tax=Pedobacter sp. ASV28 TaxID=2795123 RepID=UPI0018ED3393|nr:hypothetical protein [Pedobacter sp. ASV28]
MNNTFNLHRFNLLLKRQWLEFGKIFLITLVVAVGVFVAFYGFTLFPLEGPISARRLNFREPLFIGFGFLFISVIASSYFAHLGQKSKAVIDLMIPASTFEKFLTGVFFTSILSILSFILLFSVTDWAFITYIQAQFKTVSSDHTEPIAYFFTKNKVSAFAPLYIVPFTVTSIFLLGSIYFNRFHYIKTAISVMIFSGIWSYIVVKATEKLLAGKMPINNTGNNGKNSMEWLIFAILSALTLVVWVITYVRLKEKEV